MVDGTALEMRRACKGSVGSNPTLSARKTVTLLWSADRFRSDTAFVCLRGLWIVPR